jgi:hypothetical protein
MVLKAAAWFVRVIATKFVSFFAALYFTKPISRFELICKDETGKVLHLKQRFVLC